MLKFEFNEGTGTTVMDEASKLTGTFGLPVDPANNPLVVADSPSAKSGDKAISLNVGNDLGQGFLVIDDSTQPILDLATNAFTFETWVKIDPNDVRVYEGLGGYGSSIKMGLNNGQLLFTLLGIVDIPSGLDVPKDAWHHVAVVWEPGVGATFYLDGGSATPVAETRLPRAFTDHYLVIGAETAAGNATQAMMDRFRVHKSALTAEQLDSVAATTKAVLPSTLVAYDFSESAAPWQSSATTARPAITSNNHIENTSRPSFITDTPSGKTGDSALNFKSGQRVVIDDSGALISLDQGDSSFTMQAWVKFGQQPGARSVLYFSNGPGGALSFSVTQDRRVFVTTLGILDVQSSAFVPDDNGWHHVAVVHENGKELRFYVDGNLSDTIAYTGGVTFGRTDTAAYLGCESYGSLPYVGSLDRLRVTSGVLTAEQLDSWPIPGVQPGSPELSIESLVQVAWPTIPAGYSLQSSSDLGEPKNWTTVTNKPLVGSQGYYLLFPQTAGKVFYRLYKP